jgi:hypothetical protein
MSTSVATAQPVKTGTNGSNGTTATAQASYSSNFVASPVAIPSLYQTVAVSPATAQPTYAQKTYAQDITATTGVETPGSLGTQGPVASSADAPTDNPGA